MTDRAGLVTFAEAAKAAGVHINTVRNWRKAGMLKTAKRVIENNAELWVVELSEVLEISGGRGSQKPPSLTNNNVSDNDSPASKALATLLSERAELQSALTAAQEARRTDATTIGELKGQLQATERQIAALEADKGRLGRAVTWLAVALVLVAILAMVLIFIAR